MSKSPVRLRLLLLFAFVLGVPSLSGACGSTTATTDVPDLGVATVALTPSSAGLQVGDTMAFQAEALDASGGSVMGLTATWSSSNVSVAVVDANGLVSASDTGSTVISAVMHGVTGNAIVTVTDATTPPPPTRTVFFKEPFESSDGGARQWFDRGGRPLTLSTAEKHAGNSSLEWAWTTGQTTPAFGSARKKFSPTETVHVSFWAKYSANWEGSGQGFHPHEFYLLTNVDGDYIGPAETHLTAYIEHNYQSGLRPTLGIQDALNIDTGNIGVDLTGVTEDRAVAGCNGSTDGYTDSCYQSGSTWRNIKVWRVDAYLGDTPGSQYKNAWHFIEVYFQLNSITGGVGRPDGVMRYWIDGNLLIDHDDVLFRTGDEPTMAFHEILLGPYIGAGSPVNQSVWIDDLEIADQR